MCSVDCSVNSVITFVMIYICAVKRQCGEVKMVSQISFFMPLCDFRKSCKCELSCVTSVSHVMASMPYKSYSCTSRLFEIWFQFSTIQASVLAGRFRNSSPVSGRPPMI